MGHDLLAVPLGVEQAAFGAACSIDVSTLVSLSLSLSLSVDTHVSCRLASLREQRCESLRFFCLDQQQWRQPLERTSTM